MEIIVRGRHLDLPEQFREHAIERMQRLEQHSSALARIDVEVTRQGNPKQSDQAIRVQLTCHGRGPVIRAEYDAHDKYVAFDGAADRLTERLRRSSERRRAKHRQGGKRVPPQPVAPLLTEPEPESAPVEPSPADEAGVVFAEGPVVVREKTHVTAPMSVEDALDAMELVGHDFYLFIDRDSGLPSVVYRRRGFDYGLIRASVNGSEAVAR